MTASHRGNCAFCGRYGNLTREDGWPRWFNKVLPRPAAPGTAHNIIFGDNGEVVRHERRKVVSHNTEKLPYFCKKHCNNGWMATLEETAKPILAPLFAGEQRVLTPQDQELLGFWITKTALVMDFKNPQYRALGDEFFRDFERGRAPLSDTMIYLAQYEGDDWMTTRGRFPTSVSFESGGTIREFRMQISSFCVWRFAFQVVFNAPRGLTRDDALYAVRIHPADGESKAWPPERALTTDDFYAWSTNDRPPRFPPTPNVVE